MFDESKLVMQAKDGDKKAFEEIIRMYEKKVCSTIFYMVKNKDDVEDIAQDVFLKVYSNISKFNGNSSLYTWIYRITMNVCIDALKRKDKVIYIEDRLINQDGEEIENQLQSDDKTPDVLLEELEVRNALKNAILLLSPEHRAVIILRDIKGFTYMEIAEMLKMNLGTVKSKISRARTELKEILDKNGTNLEYFQSI